MNILFFVDNFPPETNAIASRVFERARYWVRWGQQVTVITSAPNFPEGKVYDGHVNRWYQQEVRDGIRVIRVKTFITKNEGTVLRALDFLSYVPSAVIAGCLQQRPDVVVGSSPQFFVGVAAWIVACLRRRPFIFEIADLWPASIVAVGAMEDSIPIRLLERLEMFLYRRAHAIVALTSAFKEDLVRRKIPAGKIHVVINGVETQVFVPRPRDEALTKQWKLAGRFVVGYIGTQGMAHGLENAIAAAELVAAIDRVACLLLVGTGAAHGSLVDAVRARGLTNVIFVPPQPKEEIRRFWSLCDVALVHLKNDPVFSTVIPSKMFEAMAMGLPLLLVSPRGEASRIVEEEAVGRWIRAGDPATLAQAIHDFREGHVLRAQYGVQSLATAPKYSRERQARDMYGVLTSVCGN